MPTLCRGLPLFIPRKVLRYFVSCKGSNIRKLNPKSNSLMYIPKHFDMPDFAEQFRFMQKFSFGTLISTLNEVPFATHLPFVVKETENGLKISAHFAKNNPQWKNIESQMVLVIFAEPHAYISTQFYEKELNVPTWNYVAVHVYGNVKVYTHPSDMLQQITDLIQQNEPEYLEKWESFPDKYRMGMLKDIVSFEISVQSIEGKQKLSQNRTLAEQESIINHFSRSKQPQENAIANLMQAKI